jgi:hypothetical protein
MWTIAKRTALRLYVFAAKRFRKWRREKQISELSDAQLRDIGIDPLTVRGKDSSFFLHTPRDWFARL